MPNQAVRVRRLLITLTATIMATTAVSGCGDDSDDLPPPASPPPDTPATPSPALDLTPAEQQAVDEARAKFDEFMNAYIEVSTAPLPTAETAESLFSRVEEQAAGLLPQQLRMEIVGRWGEGQIVEGSLTWAFVSVTNVDLDRTVEGGTFPRVTMQYCIDTTDWAVVDSDTGARATVSGDQHPWSVSADWSDDWGGLGQGPEGWRIAERDVMSDRSC